MPRKATESETPKVKKKLLIQQGWKALKTDEFRDGLDHNSEFGGWDSTGELEKHNTVCHASLADMQDIQVLYTYTPKPSGSLSEEAYTNYIKWLIKGSPWALQKVIPKTSVEMAAKHGFLITNTNKPANLIANFCVATRQPCENYALVKRWDEFVKQGVHPNVAFVFAEALGANVWWKANENNHEPLDIHVISTKAVERFVHGKVGYSLQAFKQSGHYFPCAGVWEARGYNKNKQPNEVMYKNFIDTTYPKALAEGARPSRRLFVTPPVKEGDFPDGNGGRGWGDAKITRSREQWTAIALAESKRMFNDRAAA